MIIRLNRYAAVDTDVNTILQLFSNASSGLSDESVTIRYCYRYNDNREYLDIDVSVEHTTCTELLTYLEANTVSDYDEI